MQEIITKLLDIILNSQQRHDILKELLGIYMTDDQTLINIQFAAFVFLSFFLEFELFLITYSKIPYNYFNITPFDTDFTYTDEEQDKDNTEDSLGILFNNKFNQKWTNNIKTYIIFNKKFQNNILEILKEYIDYLEKEYRKFIIFLYSQIVNTFKDTTTDTITDFTTHFTTHFYKDSTNKKYDHICHDWYSHYENIDNFNVALLIIFNNFISEHTYNTQQNGLFDFVFCLNNTQSCVTKTTLTIYFASRLHLPIFQIILQYVKNSPNTSSSTTIVQLLSCNRSLSHWQCGLKTCSTNIETNMGTNMETTKELNLYNDKVEVFIALLFLIYDMYLKMYLKMSLKTDIIITNKKKILNIIFNILLDSKLELFEKYYYWINEFDDLNLEKLKTMLNGHMDKYPNLNQIFSYDPKMFFSILEDVKQNGLAAVKCDSENIPACKIIVLEAVKQNGLDLEYASETLQADRNIVLEAVKQNGLALEFASETLQADKDIVSEAVKQNWLALEVPYNLTQLILKYQAENPHNIEDVVLLKSLINILNDTDIVSEAVKQNGSALYFASEILQADPKIVLEAVKQNGLALKFASKTLQADKNIVLEAVKQNGLALEFPYNLTQLIIRDQSENPHNTEDVDILNSLIKILNDTDIVSEAIKQNSVASQYASISQPHKKMKVKNKKLILEPSN